jgi:hypothetical protein
MRTLENFLLRAALVAVVWIGVVLIERTEGLREVVGPTLRWRANTDKRLDRLEGRLDVLAREASAVDARASRVEHLIETLSGARDGR